MMVIQSIRSIDGVDFGRARINGVEIVKRVGDEGTIVVLDWKTTAHPLLIHQFLLSYIAVLSCEKKKDKEEKPWILASFEFFFSLLQSTGWRSGRGGREDQILALTGNGYLQNKTDEEKKKKKSQA